MKVLALVPPDEAEKEIAEYGFLCDEFASLARRGIEVHTVSHCAHKSYQRDNVFIHAMHHHRTDPSLFLKNARFAKTLAARLPRQFRNQWWRFYWPAAVEGFGKEIVENYKIDLIHSCFAFPGGCAGSLIKELTGIPLVLSLRGFDILTEPSIGYGARLDAIFDSLFRRSLTIADIVTANSNYMMDQSLSLGTKQEKCVLVPRGVDINLFCPATEKSVMDRNRGGGPVILCVRHLVAKNGIEYLINAARIVVDEWPEAKFVFCGREEPSYRHELQKRVVALELESHVSFTGFVPHRELVNYFRICDLTVIPSVIEAAGNVILEAMACAKPVIGSNVGGIPDYISDGETGFLVESMNPRALAERILQLLNDQGLTMRMGAAGRKRVEDQYRFDMMISKIVAIYESVTDRNRHEQAGTRSAL
jgi:glycosyltransferase involved in cell wall biosynthesis